MLLSWSNGVDMTATSRAGCSCWRWRWRWRWRWCRGGGIVIMIFSLLPGTPQENVYGPVPAGP